MTRLRRERLARGLTQRELAAKIGGGCTYAAMSYLERGDVTNPRPGLRLRLETFFQLPLEVLLMPEPPKRKRAPKRTPVSGSIHHNKPTEAPEELADES